VILNSYGWPVKRIFDLKAYGLALRSALPVFR
jgi:hypothetical protein